MPTLSSALKCSVFLASLGLSSAAYAQLSVQLPDLQLQPNTPNQSFTISLQNAGAPVAVNGIIFDLQVADGGPEAGGTTDGPNVTGIDAVTGTIFQSNHGTPADSQVFPQLYHTQVSTTSGTVSVPSGSSSIGTVTFDTTGFTSGTYSYTLDTLNQRLTYTTTSSPLTPTVFDGTLTVVPEPSTYATIAGLGCLAAGFVVRRARKA